MLNTEEKLQIQLDFIQTPLKDFIKKYSEVVIEDGKIKDAEIKKRPL